MPWPIFFTPQHPNAMTDHSLPDAPRVLLVADDSPRTLSLRQQLVSLGFIPLGPAVCCEQGLDMGVRLHPDVLLLDMALTKTVNVFETATLLRDCLTLPVVLLVERVDRGLLGRIGAIGASGCLVAPVRDADLLATLETARHQADREQRQHIRERWMETSFESLEETLLAIDTDELVRFANPMAETMLGLSHEEILGQPLTNLYRLRCEDRINAFDRTAHLECQLERHDGRSLPVEEARSSIVDRAGRQLGTMVLLRDISRRRRDEASLRQSLEDLQHILEQTINALAVTSEQRDPFTAGHQQRVSRLSVHIAQGLGLSEEAQEGVRLAGLVHDIGKVYIPSEILAKSGGLSPLEMEIMRQHSEVGYQILKDVAFPWPVARMVLEHHERMDGSGYPGGLVGDAILPEARILAVADVVEAMTAHRPYRPARSLDQALEEIRNGRGTRYDPDVVDVCLHLCRNGECF